MRFMEDPAGFIFNVLLGRQLFLLPALVVFRLVSCQLLIYVSVMRTAPELSAARILRPKRHLSLLIGTLVSSIFVYAIPLPGRVADDL